MRLPISLPAAPKAFDVVGLGESSVDLVAVVDGFPRANAKQALVSMSALVGGQVATALVACARLGWRACYRGCVGSDAEGERIVQTLAAERVDTRVARRDGVRSRSALAIVDRVTGARTILELRDPALALRPEEFDVAIVTAGRLLLVDATDIPAARHAAAEARAASIPVVLDVDGAAARTAGITDVLRLADVVIASADFVAAVTGSEAVSGGLRRLEDESSARVLIATMGEAGSLTRCDGRELASPAFRVDAIDTTGAGDAFRGGFLAGWLRGGPETDLEALLEYASAVAALNCRALGAQTGLPTHDEAIQLVTTGTRLESK